MWIRRWKKIVHSFMVHRSCCSAPNCHESWPRRLAEVALALSSIGRDNPLNQWLVPRIRPPWVAFLFFSCHASTFVTYTWPFQSIRMREYSPTYHHSRELAADISTDGVNTSGILILVDPSWHKVLVVYGHRFPWHLMLLGYKGSACFAVWEIEAYWPTQLLARVSAISNTGGMSYLL